MSSEHLEYAAEGNAATYEDRSEPGAGYGVDVQHGDLEDLSVTEDAFATPRTVTAPVQSTTQQQITGAVFRPNF